VREIRNGVERRFCHLPKVETDGLDLHGSILELAEVEHVGDDTLQVLRRRPDPGDVLLLVIMKVGGVLEDRRVRAKML
jgi:hypothetical protein